MLQGKQITQAIRNAAVKHACVEVAAKRKRGALALQVDKASRRIHCMALSRGTHRYVKAVRLPKLDEMLPLSVLL